LVWRLLNRSPESSTFCTSFVMGVVSAQREVLRFAGMGAVR